MVKLSPEQVVQAESSHPVNNPEPARSGFRIGFAAEFYLSHAQLVRWESRSSELVSGVGPLFVINLLGEGRTLVTLVARLLGCSAIDELDEEIRQL